MKKTEEMALTLVKALRQVPTTVSVEVLAEEPDVVAVEMDGRGLFFLKVIEA